MLLFFNMFRGLPHEFYKYNVSDTTDIRRAIVGLPRSHFTPAVKVIINDCLVELKVLTRAGEDYDRSGRNLTARSRVGGNVPGGPYVFQRGYHTGVQNILVGHMNGTRAQGIHTIDDLYTLFKQTLFVDQEGKPYEIHRNTAPEHRYTNLLFKFLDLFAETIRERPEIRQSETHIEKMQKYLILFFMGKDPHAEERLRELTTEKIEDIDMGIVQLQGRIEGLDEELGDFSNQSDMIRHLKQNQMLYDNLHDREKEIERMEEILGDIDLDVVDYVADPTQTARQRGVELPQSYFEDLERGRGLKLRRRE